MSDQMNPWLASIYGTDGADDLEKTAQSHLLAKLAEENNVDLSQFTPEELQQLAAEVLGNNVPGQQAAPPAGAPGAFAPAAQPQAGGMMPFQMAQANQGGMQQDPGMLQKEAQAKFDEADLLGRVMAHAYTQELEKIAAFYAGGTPRSAGEKLRGAALKYKMKGRAAVEDAGKAAKGAFGKAKAHVGAHRGAYTAGAASFAGAAAGRMAGKNKEASAFEKLAEMHAAEILSNAGYDPSTGQDMAAQQQDTNAQQMQGQVNQDTGQQGQEGGTPDEQFGQALDSRALEMLAGAGYDVNEIMARLQLAQQGQA